MKFNNLIITALAGLSITLGGCQSNDESEQHYNNKLFIPASNFTKEILFKVGDANVETDISVAIAKPEGHDIKITIAAAPELLPTYKLAYYDEAAVLLPEEHYSMPQTITTIQSGSIASPKLPIEFINIGALDRNQVYVLPVTVKSAEGIEVLQSAKNYYYVFKGASLINVVCDINNNRAYPDFNGDAKFNNLKQNTFEILFKANSFSRGISTLMGIEGQYLLRLGDSEPSNQLQIASAKNVSSAELKFESGVWYHLAVVFENGYVTVYVNGVKKMSGGNTGRVAINLGAKHTNDEKNERCFWVGYSYDKNRYFDGVISEARIWNRALTAEEIQATNHFYTVDPESAGLIAYWKFNEGVGQVVKDYSSSGYDLTIESDSKWESVSLPQ